MRRTYYLDDDWGGLYQDKDLKRPVYCPYNQFKACIGSACPAMHIDRESKIKFFFEGGKLKGFCSLTDVKE